MPTPAGTPGDRGFRADSQPSAGERPWEGRLRMVRLMLISTMTMKSIVGGELKG